MIVRRCLCTAAQPRPWLFVGLGNPGGKYNGTRHNVGFEMIEAFAESVGISVDRTHFKALFGQGVVDDAGVFLAKPQTYMNLSGESAGPLAAYYKMPLNRVVVFHDDMDLPCGVLRLQDEGGHGRHNGLKSVIYHFRGNREFARLRIGIGKPPGQMDPKAFLLQQFNAAGRERIDVALQEGVGALKLLLSKGLTEVARCFNREQKYKHIRVQTMPGDKSSPLKKTIAALIQEAGPHVNSPLRNSLQGLNGGCCLHLGKVQSNLPNAIGYCPVFDPCLHYKTKGRITAERGHCLCQTGCHT